jgi:uroporphyrinogen decarboxylase
MAVAYNRLKRFKGITTGQTRVYDVCQQLAEPEKDMIDLFQVDVIDLEHSLGLEEERWKKWSLPDGSLGWLPAKLYPVRKDSQWILEDRSLTYRMPEGSLYFDLDTCPLRDADSPSDFNEVKWYYYTDEDLRYLEKKASFLSQSTDYAIMGSFGGSIFTDAQALRGWEAFLVDLVCNRSFAEDLVEKMLEVHLTNLRGYLEAIGESIHIVVFADDLGTQGGPYISPDLYREFFKSRYRKMFQCVKDHSSAHVFLHCCGSVYGLISELIDTGVEILNPVQTSAADMDPVRLKQEFGGKVTFWGGGCDTQVMLPRGRPDEIEEHVRQRIHTFAPGGGFIFTQVHNIQADVPPENICAMYKAVAEWGKYPIDGVTPS